MDTPHTSEQATAVRHSGNEAAIHDTASYAGIKRLRNGESVQMRALEDINNVFARMRTEAISAAGS
jgi:hypothetical protein